MTIHVARFTDANKTAWDDFVARSKNGTFLFFRDYMDYHRERFSDHSLVVYDNSSRIIALLPANISETMLVSHGGLTYGGFITDARMTTRLMLSVFEAALTFCQEQELNALSYKALPHIYARLPAQEDLYALFLSGAQLSERRVMTVISAQERIRLPKGRRYSLSKARKSGLTVRRADSDLSVYWDLLTQTLHERHGVHPAHTLEEIRLLQRRFPNQIQLYGCFEGAKLIAGVLIYESARVARTQYIAVSERGRDLCALDLILHNLLNEVFVSKPYFDFGTSHQPDSQAINSGLIQQKESFGGRTVAQDVYRIDLQQWNAERYQQALE
ncbi:MAG: GNAT family N-acetyltransferase [Chloroflexi bacterium]|nr:GNAT family N-acetyltransferase [Chloroflexota bacterium]